MVEELSTTMTSHDINQINFTRGALMAYRDLLNIDYEE